MSEQRDNYAPEVIETTTASAITRGGNTRRSILQGALVLAGGFFAGAPAFVAGVSGGSREGLRQGLETNRTLVKTKEGAPSGIIEEEIIDSKEFVQVVAGGEPVTLEATRRVPILLRDDKYNTTITTTAAMTAAEASEALSPAGASTKPEQKSITVITAALPEETEETYVYEVMLPEGEKNAAAIFANDHPWSYYVRPRGGKPFTVTLQQAKGAAFESDDETSHERPYVMDIATLEGFEEGDSIYVFTNIKLPPPKDPIV